jgi:sugar phosphate isomerase/epimerase
MSSLRLAHFYPWQSIPDEFVCHPLQAFAEHGTEHLTFSDPQCLQMLKRPDYAKWFFKQAGAYGMKVMDVHGLCFQHYDLDTDDRELREKSIKDHISVITQLSDLGVRTYTVHIGAALYVYPPFLDLPRLRANALHTLENILPVAERVGMKIALENSFEPPNAPDEVIWYIEQFKSPALLCCFDSGHANYMKKEGKELSKFKPYHLETTWRGNIRLEDDALGKLAPYIVTCHLHDNSGYFDDHALPGKGTTDWKDTISRLKKCPNIQSMQDETSVIRDRQTVKEMCTIFAALMKY